MTPAELSPREILQALDIQGEPTITSLQGGFDMAMWKVELDDQIYALRVFRVGTHERCKQEQIVMEAARAAHLPVPAIRKAGVWQDHPALLISWINGRTIAEELLARPWKLWMLGIRFGQMHAAIHTVTAPTALQQQAGPWITWQYAHEEQLHDRLRAVDSATETLLHLDYHPYNVLTDGTTITGVIDWTNAHAGDPRADVARTISILQVDPTANQNLFQRAGLRIFALAYRNGYQREQGVLHAMPLFYAWAGTIMQRDLASRFQANPQRLAPVRRWTNKWKTRAGLKPINTQRP